MNLSINCTSPGKNPELKDLSLEISKTEKQGEKNNGTEYPRKMKQFQKV